MNDLNLLKTHAIVSRSWLLAQLYNPKQKIASSNNINEHIKWYDREDHLLFDVCADDHCQRYQGVTKVISENAKTAVAATAGKVLSSENEICDARFSKCCGGITEDFYHVWQAEKKSYLTSIIDSPNTQSIANLSSLEFIQSAQAAYCNTNDRKVLQQVLIDFDQKTADFYRWTIQYSQDEISALIRQKSGIDFGEIIDLIPVERGASHRIIRLKIVGTKKSLTIGKELEIRKWLSSSHLYSSAFLVKKTTKEQNQIPTSFQLTGAGWGHGVGMCQIGAAVMSQQGFSELEILQHYFKNSNILQLY